MEITLERQSPEYDLREGQIFTDFLQEADWELLSDNPIPVNSLDDVPLGRGGPIKYKLSPEELAKVCPYTDPDFTRGVEAAMEIIKTTPKVAYTDHQWGANAVGCGNLTYKSTDDISAESMSNNYFLHFDGHAHKTLNKETKSMPKTNTVSNFFSNFTNAHFSAPLHSTLVSSTVVMCAGVKTWFFLDPSCCNDFGHHMYSGALLGKGFNPKTKFLLLQTTPGDVVTFGSFQHHMVITEPGPVFMQTYRHMDRRVIFEGIKRFGWKYVKAVRDATSTSTKGTTANQAHEHPLRNFCKNEMKEWRLQKLQERIYSMIGK